MSDRPVSKQEESFRHLLAAAKKVLAHLNERIEAAPANAVPVFEGIADLHDAINRAEEHV